MIQLLTHISAWEVIRTIFWVIIVYLPFFIAIHEGAPLAHGNESLEWILFGFAIQGILSLCFYTGVIK